MSSAGMHNVQAYLSTAGELYQRLREPWPITGVGSLDAEERLFASDFLPARRRTGGNEFRKEHLWLASRPKKNWRTLETLRLLDTRILS